ncbi:MAG: TIGR03960 family B12-binding radical SAM protein [Fibrobacterales bacterium]
MVEIREKLEKVLSQVDNPGRYIGSEANSVYKDFDTCSGTIAFVFPDTYEVGMSNNGLKILYHVVNREEDLLAETSFAPWIDMSELLRREEIPLYTHQSYRSIAEYDCVGISLQTELNFTNVPYVLELGNIPAWSKDRNESHPFVIGGGPAMANPEPVADFYDAFVIGDGELVTPDIVRMVGTMRKAGEKRESILKALSEIQGIYVPSLIPMEPNFLGEMAPVDIQQRGFKNHKGIKRTWMESLDPTLYPIKNLIPNIRPIHDRYAVEVMRGCTQGCRFCQAGYWYRPSRELGADDIVDLAKEGIKATGCNELGLLSLSTADYSQVEPLTDVLINEDDFSKTDVSLPSLRVNAFGKELAEKTSAISSSRSATFAPETGSDRLRKVINKTITNQNMVDAAHHVFSGDYNNIKLYTMIGLPTETIDDMDEFIELIENLVTVGRKYKQNFSIHASIGILIPKTFTPMQWVGFVGKEEALERIYKVKNHFYRNRNVRISWSSWETAHLESFYSRGDRSIAPMIYEAYERGLIFESFNEFFDHDTWEEIWDKHNYPVANIQRERNLDELLPWDVIHAGVNKGYLKREYKKMFEPESPEVPNCKWEGNCQSCGIPGTGDDTVMATAPDKYAGAPSLTKEEILKKHEDLKEEIDDVHSYIVLFNKSDLARFLPHQNTMKFIEKAFMRVDAPLRYSKGYNQRPKIQNGGALPLGLHSHCEFVIIEFTQEIPTDEAYIDELNKMFPKGIAIHSIEKRLDRKMAFAQTISYTYSTPCDHSDIISRFNSQSLPIITNHKGRRIAIQPEIQSISTNSEGALEVVLTTNSNGNAISPFAVFSGLLEISYDDARELSICKSAIVF